MVNVKSVTFQSEIFPAPHVEVDNLDPATDPLRLLMLNCPKVEKVEFSNHCNWNYLMTAINNTGTWKLKSILEPDDIIMQMNDYKNLSYVMRDSLTSHKVWIGENEDSYGYVKEYPKLLSLTIVCSFRQSSIMDWIKVAKKVPLLSQLELHFNYTEEGINWYNNIPLDVSSFPMIRKLRVFGLETPEERLFVKRMFNNNVRIFFQQKDSNFYFE